MRTGQEREELDVELLRQELHDVIQVGLRLSSYATGVARTGAGIRDTMMALVRAIEERARKATSVARIDV
jgi:hypothetical protein